MRSRSRAARREAPTTCSPAFSLSRSGSTPTEDQLSAPLGRRRIPRLAPRRARRGRHQRLRRARALHRSRAAAASRDLERIASRWSGHPDVRRAGRRRLARQLARRGGAARASPTTSVAHLVDLLDQMHASPAWKDALERNNWVDLYLTGPDYESFLAEESARVAVRPPVHRSRALDRHENGADAGPTRRAVGPSPRSRSGGSSSSGASRLRSGQDTTASVPRFFPYVVAAGLIVSGALLTRDALRRGNAWVGPRPTQASCLGRRDSRRWPRSERAPAGARRVHPRRRAPVLARRARFRESSTRYGTPPSVCSLSLLTYSRSREASGSSLPRRLPRWSPLNGLAPPPLRRLPRSRSSRQIFCGPSWASCSEPRSGSFRASAPRSPWRCLLPVTYGLEPVGAFIMFAGIYYGAMYGGSTTSILMNTPGESGSIITALEGNKMARAGRASAALATAAIGSFVAGTIGTVALTFAAPALANLALDLRSGRVLRSHRPRLHDDLVRARRHAVARPREPVLRARPRPRRHRPADRAGALHARPAAAARRHPRRRRRRRPLRRRRDPLPRLEAARTRRGDDDPTAGRGCRAEDWARSWKPWLRGTLLGFPIGGLPTGGAEIPTFLSYSLERRLSSNPEEFGHGAIEGVAGPEAANNAAAAGVLVPLLTLGLPTSSTAAIMLAAFQQFNLQPGPLIFTANPELVWGLIASLYLGNVMLLLLNLPLAPLWARLLENPGAAPVRRHPRLRDARHLQSRTTPPSTSGSCTSSAMVGFVMRRVDIPVAPAIIGMILGPMAEQQFRRALAISQGDPSVFFTRPIAAVLLGLALLALVAVPLWNWLLSRQK